MVLTLENMIFLIEVSREVGILIQLDLIPTWRQILLARLHNLSSSMA